jgi:hypothetical protein
MGLSADQRNELVKRLEANRVATLCHLVGQVARHSLDPDVDSRSRERFRSADPSTRRMLLSCQLSAARLVDRLGSAMMSRQRSSEDIADDVASLVDADLLSSESIDLVCRG